MSLSIHAARPQHYNSYCSVENSCDHSWWAAPTLAADGFWIDVGNANLTVWCWKIILLYSPQPDSDGIVLIQLTVPSMNSVEFTSEQGRVVSAVRMLMAENGYPDVTVSVYAVVEEDAGLQ